MFLGNDYRTFVLNDGVVVEQVNNKKIFLY